MSLGNAPAGDGRKTHAQTALVRVRVHTEHKESASATWPCSTGTLDKALFARVRVTQCPLLTLRAPTWCALLVVRLTLALFVSWAVYRKCI